MREGNWNQINTSTAFHSHPLRETALYSIPPKQALCECVTYFCPERQEKHRTPGINQEQSLFSRFLPAFCFPATHLTSSGALPEGSGWLHLPHPSAASLLGMGQASYRSHLHQSKAFKRLLKEFRCSRARSGGGMGGQQGPDPPHLALFEVPSPGSCEP